ncbi:MAG: hypothetical protein Q9227_003937 [Pyrenula ochraceoflavens]
MPEQVIESHNPCNDAIDKVTSNGSFEWKFAGWTEAGQAANKLKMFDAQPNPSSPLYSGMRGQFKHPSQGWKNFTIRHDYDFAKGAVQNGGKGYHVNVELPDAKYAFTSRSRGEQYAADCMQMLSERVKHDGQQSAAQWFMTKKSSS